MNHTPPDGYNLLIIGGSRDGEVLPVSRIEPFYVLAKHQQKDKLLIHEKVPVEYYFHQRFVLRMGDSIWEYHILVEGDFWRANSDGGFIYQYHLSDTYVRRYYSKDYGWRHQCTKTSPTALAK